jgi:hypothetical protein
MTGSLAELQLSGGLLDVTGSLSTSVYTQSGGTLGGAGTVALSGASNTWSGGTLTGGGTLSIQTGATLQLTGSTKYLGSRTLNNQGTINWTTGVVHQTGTSSVINNGLFLPFAILAVLGAALAWLSPRFRRFDLVLYLVWILGSFVLLQMTLRCSGLRLTRQENFRASTALPLLPRSVLSPSTALWTSSIFFSSSVTTPVITSTM